MNRRNKNCMRDAIGIHVRIHTGSKSGDADEKELLVRDPLFNSNLCTCEHPGQPSWCAFPAENKVVVLPCSFPRVENKVAGSNGKVCVSWAGVEAVYIT